ncbi:PA3496 family putative envelope integrity protein [Pseudomonas sp. S2_A02]
MAQPYEERNSAVKTRRQQEDQRRMEFRRAIEDRSERRQLLAEIGEFPDDLELNYWQAAPVTSRRSAQPGR